MPIVIRCDVRGQEGVIEAIKALVDAGGAARGKTLRAIRDVMVEGIRSRFKTQTSPDGIPWKPSLRARVEGGRTLVDKGLLRNSIMGAVNGNIASVWTASIYSAIHHFGGIIRAKNKPYLWFPMRATVKVVTSARGGMLKKPRRVSLTRWVRLKQVTIPARPYMGLSEFDWAKITQVVDTVRLGVV